jgi:hypothetical protein
MFWVVFFSLVQEKCGFSQFILTGTHAMGQDPMQKNMVDSDAGKSTLQRTKEGHRKAAQSSLKPHSCT